MELLTDVAFLSRVQFALVVFVHFVFVPLSIGIGLIMAINETRYYRSRNPKDEAATRFWVKIFTTTFAVGVATGITMEFSFGTNWADYSRFVGDIFGAPLAAEALLAFFLESVFLGIVIFGRKKVSPKFYLVSAWLVFFGSCLSALWILIANSWMQTPAGAELVADGSKAVITDFFAAAFNPSTLPRYTHTVLAALALGSFVAIAMSAWYMHKNKHEHFAQKTMKVGVVAAVIATGCLLVSAHSAAVVVAEEQLSKIAMMEGHYETGTLPLYAVGWVDEEAQETAAPIALPGFTSFLASGDFNKEYPGLNQIVAENDEIEHSDLPVNLVFQSYHLMVALFGVIVLVLILAAIAAFKKGSNLGSKKWVQWILILSPLAPFIAIQSGWSTAEFGRQPYVVYPSVSGPDGVSLLTNEAASQSVTAPELMITIALFAVVYLLLLVAWVRLIGKAVKEGPVLESEKAAVAGSDTAASAASFAVGSDASADEKKKEA
ncbi:cytochrome ubiquinol oxidase subunit I [Slackia piriformis]